jgi:hypothetical protein
MLETEEVGKRAIDAREVPHDAENLRPIRAVAA